MSACRRVFAGAPAPSNLNLLLRPATRSTSAFSTSVGTLGRRGIIFRSTFGGGRHCIYQRRHVDTLNIKRGTLGDNALHDSRKARALEQKITELNKAARDRKELGEELGEDTKELQLSVKDTEKDLTERQKMLDLDYYGCTKATPGQMLYPAEQEDIDILSQSKWRYLSPRDVEGGIIIRLVRLSDPVTSPVGRVIRNRVFGVRKGQKYYLSIWGIFSVGMCIMLGLWQIRRMHWKRELISKRQTRLQQPRISVTHSPFPWSQNVEDWEYRVFEVRGVFDHAFEMKVGPRPTINPEGTNKPGYLIVTPLRLEDGSTVLVNRGFVEYDKLWKEDRPEMPEWVEEKNREKS